MKKIFFKSLLIIALLIVTFVLPVVYSTGIAVYFRLALLFFIVLESFKLFKIIIIDAKINHALSNFATTLFSFFIIFMILETVFMFVPRTHFFDYTLASKLWYAKYYKPINSLGFRDNEPNYNHNVILFVGDSFTAGSGLKSVDERFSNIVGKELNKKENKYTVINIGHPGADSSDEFHLMQQVIYMTKIRPEIIVLQYFGDDIAHVAAEKLKTFEGFKPFVNVNAFLKPAVRCSYFLNYMYFLFPNKELTSSALSLMQQTYRDNNMLLKHQEQLKLFINYARENHIQLIAVVFPVLEDIEISNSIYVNDIVNYFEVHKITTINVSRLVKNIPLQERIINKNDGHPSKSVHASVAHEVLRKIRFNGNNE